MLSCRVFYSFFLLQSCKHLFLGLFRNFSISRAHWKMSYQDKYIIQNEGISTIWVIQKTISNSNSKTFTFIWTPQNQLRLSEGVVQVNLSVIKQSPEIKSSYNFDRYEPASKILITKFEW